MSRSLVSLVWAYLFAGNEVNVSTTPPRKTYGKEDAVQVFLWGKTLSFQNFVVLECAQVP